MLGIVLQDVNLFTGTVLGNIRYGRLDATDEDCVKAAKLAGADDFIRLPHHAQSNGALSRDSSSPLTRAAVADPPVMILDEAPPALIRVQRRLSNVVWTPLCMTVPPLLLLTDLYRNADVIVVLDHGRIVSAVRTTNFSPSGNVLSALHRRL